MTPNRGEGDVGEHTAEEGYDVLVVGAGNAALTAAIAARQVASEAGSEVGVLEGAPETLRGGNIRFTDGMFRFTYHNLDEIKRMLREHDDPSDIEFDPYSAENHLKDINRVTRGEYNPELIDIG